jgi:hypothetical protein
MHGIFKVKKIVDDSHVDRNSGNAVIVIFLKQSQVAEMQYRNCRASFSENYQNDSYQFIARFPNPVF